jgi:hypothetical protein
LVWRWLKSALRRTEVIYSRKDTASADPNSLMRFPTFRTRSIFLRKSAELATGEFLVTVAALFKVGAPAWLPDDAYLSRRFAA